MKKIPVKEVGRRHSSTAHFLHVYFGIDLSSSRQSRKEALETTFSRIDHRFPSVSKKSVPRAIYDFQEENEVGMLVMINNKHSFFKNLLFTPVVNEIGFHVKVPFLVIPSPTRK